MANEERRGWLTRNLIVLCGVSLLQDSASELLYPVLPIFLTVTLGAPVAAVGAVEGLAEGVASVTKVVAGRLADRFRRRPLVGAGYGLAALGKLVVAVAGVWPVVLLGRSIDRVGKGIRGAPRDALLVEGIPSGARGRAFGLHRAADTGGAVIGPLIGLAAYEALNHHIRPLLFIAVIPAVASTALVAAVREGRRPPPPRPEPAARRSPPAPAVPRSAPSPLGGRYRRVVMILALFSLANFPDALLLLRVKDLGFSLVGVILVYVAYNLSYAALSYPAGSLSDRLSPPRVFAAGLLFFAAGYLGLGLAHDRAWVWPVMVLYGGFNACTDGVGKAWVSSLVDREHQGSAQGLFQGAIGGGVLVAGVWAGLAWGRAGRVPLLLSGAVGLATAVLLLVVGERLTPTGTSPGQAGPIPVTPPGLE